MQKNSLDGAQIAAATQFDRQSDRYGKSHILADTKDVAAALATIVPPAGGRALDIATGGGHTALYLAKQGWHVMAGDIAPRMLENTRRLAEEAGFNVETRLFPAEDFPFAEKTFDLVTSRVAPHHFSSPEKFVAEVTRVLRPGGYFMLIDGSVPDNDPETEAWLHTVEKWRDPSHGRFLSRATWEKLVAEKGLSVVRSQLDPMKQPDLNWYFETAATPAENRQRVISAVQLASAHVRAAMRLADEDGKTVWWWPRLTLLAKKPA